MINCKICGHAVQYRLIEHLVKTHKMDVEEYKLKYGPVISAEYHAKVSKKSKEMWKDDDYRNKTNIARNESWTDELKDKQSTIIKNVYKNGFKCWNDGLTKENHPSLVLIGEKNKKNLTGRTKEEYPYLENKSKLMTARLNEYWEEAGLFRKYFSNKENFDNWRDKISKTISAKCRSGEIKCISGHFKTGYYNGTFYQSGLELETMKLLDSINDVKKWERNFDAVDYIDVKGKTRRYLPDFKITLNDDDVVVLEMKGFPDKYLQEKITYAKKKYKHYMVCYTIEEAKEKLYEIINNKKHNQIKK